MKEIIKSILAAVFIYGFLYLSTAFVQVNLNIMDWDETSRFFVVLFGGMFWLLTSSVIFVNKTNK